MSETSKNLKQNLFPAEEKQRLNTAICTQQELTQLFKQKYNLGIEFIQHIFELTEQALKEENKSFDEVALLEAVNLQLLHNFRLGNIEKCINKKVMFELLEIEK
jgi:hypothetical protein